MMFCTPDCMASSTPYWINGLSTKGSISFGCALVAGRNRVPSPAAGKTALRTFTIIAFDSNPLPDGRGWVQKLTRADRGGGSLLAGDPQGFHLAVEVAPL